MSEAALEYDKVCQDYLTGLYEGLSGFISYEPGEKEGGEKGKVFLTYGEILYPSVNKVIGYLDINENDVFYDLGSGIGKVPLQFFLKTPVKKAYGVEASKKRNDHAIRVYEHLKLEFPELFKTGRQLGCMESNFLEADITDATIIYTCSTCFNEELLADIGSIVDRCPNIKYVVSMKPIPSKLPFDTILEIECTWDKTKCYVYAPAQEGAVEVESTEEVKLEETKEVGGTI